MIVALGAAEKFFDLQDGSFLCAVSKMARYSEDYELSLGKRPTVWSQKVR